MKRMIPNKLIEWAKKLFNLVDVENTTTQVGGHLEVDGNLEVNENLEVGGGINCEPVDISIFALEALGDPDEVTGEVIYRTIYSFEQIYNIVKKNLVNGFINDEFILRVTKIAEDSIELQWILLDYDTSVNAFMQYRFIKQTDAEGSCLVYVLNL